MNTARDRQPETPPTVTAAATAVAAPGRSKSNDRASRREHVARWREGRRRVDYAPSEAALRVILHHLKILDPTLAGTIDRLVIEGHRRISGNASECCSCLPTPSGCRGPWCPRRCQPSEP